MQKAAFYPLKGHVLQCKRRHIGNPLAVRLLAGGRVAVADKKPKILRQAAHLPDFLCNFA